MLKYDDLLLQFNAKKQESYYCLFFINICVRNRILFVGSNSKIRKITSIHILVQFLVVSKKKFITKSISHYLVNITTLSNDRFYWKDCERKSSILADTKFFKVEVFQVQD